MSTKNKLQNSDITGKLVNIANDNTDLFENGVDNIQEHGLVLDGDVDTDKQILFRINGIDKWALQGCWRNEDGEFLYFYNLDSAENILVISRNGRIAFNTPTNLILSSSYFEGTGVNDMTPSGIYEGKKQREIRITIDGNDPDTFKWEYSFDEINFVEVDTGIEITEGEIELSYGIKVSFGEITGHNIGDKFMFRVFPQECVDTISIKPPMFKYIYGYDGINYSDITYEMSTTNYYEESDEVILSDTNNALYIGNNSIFNSIYFILSPSVGISLQITYWNGELWLPLNENDHLMVDSTENFSQNGDITWSKDLLSNWSKTEINNINAYWIKIKTLTEPSVSPIINSIIRQTKKRFSVYSSFLDFSPNFSVNGDGTIEAYEIDRQSDSETFRLSEYVTEDRLRKAVSLFIEREKYFCDNGIFGDVLPEVFSETVSWNNTQKDIPQLVGTWIEDSAYGVNVPEGVKFEVYVFLQKSVLNRQVDFSVKLVKWHDAEPDPIISDIDTTSNTITAPTSTNIEAYAFRIIVDSEEIMEETDKIGIRIYATPRTANAQTATFWGGGTYMSTFGYPTLTALSQLIPYTGAENNVDLGDKNFSTTGSATSGNFKLSDLNSAPSHAGDTGVKGDIRITDSHIYICINTNTWKRVEISTW